jgi:hypothetical protein
MKYFVCFWANVYTIGSVIKVSNHWPTAVVLVLQNCFAAEKMKNINVIQKMPSMFNLFRVSIGPYNCHLSSWSI